MAAISFLVYSLLTTDNTTKVLIDQIKNVTDINKILVIFLIKFLPRLSVSIFIELFSFFFLRMYRRNLENITYLNNERDNIEIRLITLQTAIIYQNQETLNVILLELIKIERNFVLKKDETTAEIEKEKTRNTNFYKDTIDNLAKFLQKEK